MLDEPLTGLDPVQRRRLIALFHRLGDDGRCVLVSSHVLDEVSRLGSRVLVIAQGRLVASGDFRDLRELMDDRPHRIRLGTDDPRRLATALVDRGLVGGADARRRFGDRRHHRRRRHRPRSWRRSPSSSASASPRSSPLDDDLESVFRYLVERR